MQVQGSGYVEYSNGRNELFAYNSNNRHPYRSIEKFIMRNEAFEVPNLSINGIKRFIAENPHLQDTILFSNPSYTFFAPKASVPKGAGHVPLTANYSIAVDKKYIPLGSIVLAAFPVYDHDFKRVIKHDYRILIAQDVGGAIKGPGHIDYYFGSEPGAQRQAGSLNHYGQIWLLLPKEVQGPISSNKDFLTHAKN